MICDYIEVELLHSLIKFFNLLRAWKKKKSETGMDLKEGRK